MHPHHVDTPTLPRPTRQTRTPPIAPRHPSQAAANVRALMDALPPMRPLVMVLKVFLQQRELNEVGTAEAGAEGGGYCSSTS